MSTDPNSELPILAFNSGADLRAWLEEHHATSGGMWLRIYKKGSRVRSVTFHEVLEEGLCFGWSESLRRPGDDESYLQRFMPRRAKGTTSLRNRRLAAKLIAEGRMTDVGRGALGLS
jgi:uncharacterized protein YdeI (YjbR/CyaY-like superfamily)